MQRHAHTIVAFAVAALITVSGAATAPAQDTGAEVSTLIEHICAGATPPCSDLGELDAVPIPDRLAIREALAVLRHALGAQEPVVRDILRTPLLSTSAAAAIPGPPPPAPARGFVLRHNLTGELYLLVDSTQLTSIPATIRVLAAGSAVRNQVTETNHPFDDTPTAAGAEQSLQKLRCELQPPAIRETASVLKRVRNALAGLSPPVPHLLAAFDREIDANARELHAYLEMCGQRT